MSESDWRIQTLAASATWRGKLLPPRRWSQLWRRAPWTRRLCSAMPEPSTAGAGVDEWLASLGEPRARTCPSPASVLGSADSAPVSSGTSSASSVTRSRSGSSGRTSGEQLPLFQPSSRPSRQRATAALGVAFVRVMWEPRTDGPASSCWPTVTTSDGTSWPGHGAMMQGSPSLRTMAVMWPTATAQRSGNNRGGAAGRVGPVRPSLDSLAPEVTRGMWPTARASDGEKGGPNQRGSAGDLMLPSAVVLWATATARDWKSGEHSEVTERRNARPLAEQAWRACRSGPLAPLMLKDGKSSSSPPPGSPRLSLNPAFVAWLMGWRWLLAGLTASNCSDSSETASCRSRPRQQSA